MQRQDAAHGTRTDPPARATRVIALLNQKGGVGKTTSAVNIGAALAQAGQRVCLLDLDPQSHLTLHLGIEPDRIKRTLYDMLVEPDCTAEDALIENARPNLDTILAEVDLAGAETELARLPDRQSVLRRKFMPIADRYDVVLIDCPPSLGLLTLNALTIASEIFVPMQAHFLALQGVGRLLETVGLVSRSVNPDLRVTGIILCMHEQQTTLAKEIVSDLDAFFEQASDSNVPWSTCRVLRPAIRRNIKLAEAPSFGKTIFDYAPWCPGALDYRKLVDRLLARWTEELAAVAAPAQVVETKPTPPVATPVPAAAPTIEVSAPTPPAPSTPPAPKPVEAAEPATKDQALP